MKQKTCLPYALEQYHSSSRCEAASAKLTDTRSQFEDVSIEQS